VERLAQYFQILTICQFVPLSNGMGNCATGYNGRENAYAAICSGAAACLLRNATIAVAARSDDG
jgi:hypothetical protein